MVVSTVDLKAMAEFLCGDVHFSWGLANLPGRDLGLDEDVQSLLFELSRNTSSTSPDAYRHFEQLVSTRWAVFVRWWILLPFVFLLMTLVLWCCMGCLCCGRCLSCAPPAAGRSRFCAASSFVYCAIVLTGAWYTDLLGGLVSGIEQVPCGFAMFARDFVHGEADIGMHWHGIEPVFQSAASVLAAIELEVPGTVRQVVGVGDAMADNISRTMVQEVTRKVGDIKFFGEVKLSTLDLNKMIGTHVDELLNRSVHAAQVAQDISADINLLLRDLRKQLERIDIQTEIEKGMQSIYEASMQVKDGLSKLPSYSVARAINLLFALASICVFAVGLLCAQSSGRPGRLCAGLCMHLCFLLALVSVVPMTAALWAGTLNGALCGVFDHPTEGFMPKFVGMVIADKDELADIPPIFAKAMWEPLTGVAATCLIPGSGRWMDPIFGDTPRKWTALASCVFDVPYADLNKSRANAEDPWTYNVFRRALRCLRRHPWQFAKQYSPLVLDELVILARRRLTDWPPDPDDISLEDYKALTENILQANVDGPAFGFERLASNAIHVARPGFIDAVSAEVDRRFEEEGMDRVSSDEKARVRLAVLAIVADELDNMLTLLRARAPQALREIEEAVAAVLGKCFQQLDDYTVPLANCGIVGRFTQRVGRSALCGKKGFGGTVRSVISLTFFIGVSCLVAACAYFSASRHDVFGRTAHHIRGLTFWSEQPTIEGIQLEHFDGVKHFHIGSDVQLM